MKKIKWKRKYLVRKKEEKGLVRIGMIIPGFNRSKTTILLSISLLFGEETSPGPPCFFRSY
jgi:hypothetical protein